MICLAPPTLWLPRLLHWPSGSPCPHRPMALAPEAQGPPWPDYVVSLRLPFWLPSFMRPIVLCIWSSQSPSWESPSLLLLSLRGFILFSLPHLPLSFPPFLQFFSPHCCLCLSPLNKNSLAAPPTLHRDVFRCALPPILLLAEARPRKEVSGPFA